MPYSEEDAKFIEGEIAYVRDLLSRCPENDVLSKLSLHGRINALLDDFRKKAPREDIKTGLARLEAAWLPNQKEWSRLPASPLRHVVNLVFLKLMMEKFEASVKDLVGFEGSFSGWRRENPEDAAEAMEDVRARLGYAFLWDDVLDDALAGKMGIANTAADVLARKFELGFLHLPPDVDSVFAVELAFLASEDPAGLAVEVIRRAASLTARGHYIDGAFSMLPASCEELAAKIAVLDPEDQENGARSKVRSLLNLSENPGFLAVAVANAVGRQNIGRVDCVTNTMVPSFRADPVHISRMLMMLSGMPWASSYARDYLRNGDMGKKYDVIVAVPPWGKKEESRFPDKNLYFCSEWAHILHAVESLTPEGTLTVVVPVGMLFRRGYPCESRMREELVGANLIDTIIVLPGNVMPFTGYPPAMLVLKKDRQRKDILFIDVEDKEPPRSRGYADFDGLSPETVNLVVDAVMRRENDGTFARVVDPSEIFQNGTFNDPFKGDLQGWYGKHMELLDEEKARKGPLPS